MSAHSKIPPDKPYEVDRTSDEQPDRDKRDQSQHGEETGKKSRREVAPPVKRKPNEPDKPAH